MIKRSRAKEKPEVFYVLFENDHVNYIRYPAARDRRARVPSHRKKIFKKTKKKKKVRKKDQKKKKEKAVIQQTGERVQQDM